MLNEMINSHNVNYQVLISKQSVSKFAEGEDKVSKLLYSCEYFPSISQACVDSIYRNLKNLKISRTTPKKKER